MNLIRNIAAGIFLSSSLSLAANEQIQPTNIQCILDCISEIESGNDDKAIGRNGERSRYQILHSTWVIYTDLDFFTYSTNTSHAQGVARDHVTKLILKFHEIKRTKPSPGQIYAMYNCGYSFMFNRDFDINRLPKALYKRTTRFENLYYKNHKQLQLKLY